MNTYIPAEYFLLLPKIITMMTDHTWIAPTIAAIAGVLVSILNNRKATEIHSLVNSNLHAVQADLAAAKQQIKDLQDLVSKMVGIPTPPVVPPHL
jgi:hypothetical protein